MAMTPENPVGLRGIAFVEFAHPDPLELHRLWSAFQGVVDRLDAAQAGQAYRDMLAILVELQPTVAAFFDKGGVMVMDPDAGLRENRLSLLHRILAPFAAIADFRLASQGPAAPGLAAQGSAS